MAEVKRRRGENFDAMMRRFRRRIQQSGRLLQAKKVRFRARVQNETKKKQSALHRLAAQRERDYLLKLGKLPVEEQRRRSF